ncbi:A24 family peptidase [Virgibacillus ndiopensis]|uniref:A24 family peptidase n=1 Tax=Virgibacillus ndiopensis TaxID=2004408 RepID=UPI000C089EE7|nr:A24 family peptidase [Virgibacillus ndiopensis]
MLQVEDYILIIFIVIAFITDVTNRKLPNWLTVSGVIVGIGYHLGSNGVDGLLFSFFGLLVAGAIFLVLYNLKAVGAGDVKLFAGIGAMVGVEQVFFMSMYSIIFAGLIGIIILVFTKTFLRKMIEVCFSIADSIFSRNLSNLEEYKMTKGTRFPFMYSVIPAVLLTYFISLH